MCSQCPLALEIKKNTRRYTCIGFFFFLNRMAQATIYIIIIICCFSPTAKETLHPFAEIACGNVTSKLIITIKISFSVQEEGTRQLGGRSETVLCRNLPNLFLINVLKLHQFWKRPIYCLWSVNLIGVIFCRLVQTGVEAWANCILIFALRGFEALQQVFSVFCSVYLSRAIAFLSSVAREADRERNRRKRKVKKTLDVHQCFR